MRVEKILAELSRRDVHVAPNGENLHVRAKAGAMSPELRDLLTKHKAELLDYLKTPGAPIPYAPSSGQRRLWFLDRVGVRPSAEYTMLLGWEITGPLDPTRLQKTLNEVVRRNESLRTRFMELDGEPIALVLPHATLDLPLTVVDGDRSTRELMIEEARHTRFDLQRGASPLFHAKLVRFSGERHLLILVQHHIVTDGTSIGQLSLAIANLYASPSSTATASAQRTPTQFRDYARWEHAWLGSAEAQAKAAHWERQLAGVAPLQLGTPSPATRTGRPRAAAVSFRLPSAQVSALKDFAERQRTTLFITLVSAYATLLHRYSQQLDFGIGAILSNRDRWEDVSGFLANTVVLRCDFRERPTFRTFLARMQGVVADAMAHQELPYAEIVKAVRGHAPASRERDGRRDPLVRASIELGSGLIAAIDAGDTSWQPVLTSADGSIDDGVAKFDLGLSMVELSSTGEMLGKIEFDPEIYSTALITRFSKHLARLLSSIVESPDAEIATLPFLGDDEVRTLVHEWNDTDASCPRDKCVHELFEAQAARTPHATAVAFEGKELTFDELNRSAEQLARVLRRNGVGPEKIVGLSIERSIEMVIVMLAILKAGGAFVPIDPSYPDERRRFLREDARAVLTITRETLAALLAPDGATESFEALPPPHATPDNLAYVIYTSGSTGKPKGVMVTHLGLVNYLTWATRAYDRDADGAPVHTSLSFDLTVTALWVPWLLGRKATLLAEVEGVEALELALLGERPRPFDFIKLTPTHLEALNQRFHAPLRSGPRALVVGGEALHPETIARFRAISPATETIVNEYGPTETVVGCCVYSWTPGPHAARPNAAPPNETSSQRTVPIGRPIANTKLYVLDDRRQLVPIGATGELYVGGLGVARGYLHRPALTDAHFVASPFSPGERLYRTGDLVRYHDDGNLEFVGRADDQVKVRGYRVELGEIEATLLTHSHVERVAVAVRDDKLVAYVTRNKREEQPSDLPRLLREHAQRSLPRPMVPATFVVLTDLPVTSNGKVDRAALPAPDVTEGAGAYVAPRDPAERALAEIWRDVLRLQRSVSVTDNFFEIGGDSILSIQVVSRAEKAGFKLSPNLVFRHQTIAELAPHALATPERGRSSPAPATRGAVVLTPIQRWFLEANLAAPHHFNQAIMLRLEPHIERPRLERAIRETIAAHDAFRLRFVRSADGWTQRYDAGESEPTVEVWTLGTSEGELEHRATELQSSLSLTDGPLVRAVWIDAPHKRERRLLIVAHHLIVDAVSWGIVLDEIAGRYEDAFVAPPTASFQVWAAAVDAVATRERASSYWLEQERVPTGELPTDEEAEAGSEGAVVITSALSRARTEDLLQRVPRAYGTRTDEALLAALTTALATFTGSDRVRVEVEGHGREQQIVGVDVSRTVGWFTTMYPVVLERKEDLGATLRSVKEVIRRVPSRGVGHPLPTRTQPGVLFNYLGQGGLTRTLLGEGGLTADGVGELQSRKNAPLHPISINAWIDGEATLQIRWAFDPKRFRRATIERLAAEVIRELVALIGHCLEDGVGGYTPSDFDLAALSSAELELLLAHQPSGRGRRGIDDIYPLSPMQEGILFESLQASRAGTYVEQIIFPRERGRHVDPRALEEAFSQVMRRHPSLRTTFAWSGLRRPLQIVHRDVDIPIATHGLDDLSATSIDHLSLRRRREGFDLTRAPLLRVDLVQDSILFTFHHLLMDGWSMARVLGEVSRAYEAALAGNSPATSITPATTAPMRYRDYVAWLGVQDVARAKAYFRELLRGFKTPIALKVPEKTFASSSSVEGHAFIEQRLGRATTDDVATMSRRNGLTLATVLQGVWALLLSRYCNEEDVVFGTVTSGRPSELTNVEGAVGLFVATLPIRTRVDRRANLIDWLRALQAQNAELRQYEYSSLADVQTWCDIPAGTKLFESLFVYENYPVDHDSLATLFDLDRAEAWETTNYPLNLAILLRRGELAVRLSYDASRFERALIQQIVDHYVELLCAFTSLEQGASARLGDVMMLTHRERELLLKTWNDTAVTYGPRAVEACLHELFEDQVAKTPDALAIKFNGASISYRQLDARANQLAHRLRALGVGPEVRVGVSMDRSIDMVVALLGVFKAGGAYVPLDPTYPPDRLEYMLADATCPVVVTERRHSHDRASSRTIVIDGDADQAILASLPTTKPLTRALAPSNAAYVIYTSGSTGMPKGVVGPHDAIINRLFWMWEAFPFDEDEVGSHKTSLNFLDSVWEIFGPLLRGVPAVAIDSVTARDPFALVRLLAAEKITRIVLVPSLLRAVIDAAKALHEPLSSLRYWTTSGEAIPPELANQFGATFPHATLINLYGASELAADSTCYVVPKAVPPGAPMPIGKPIANTQVYVLDAHGEPMPIGLPGELWVGGLGLARGYHARPAATAERFIPNRFGPGRLYRTGDSVRWRRDGDLEYLGRVDHQVKIRGYRIELGEVESALRQAPGVGASLVVVREDAPGDRRLIGYVVPSVKGDEASSAMSTMSATLREALKATLPEYMVPSAFMLLDAFPLTPSGKIDRNALPAPEYEREARETKSFLAPNTATEIAVAAAWSSVLGVGASEIGIDDNFFELGGHSLLGMQAVARLHQTFGVAVPLIALFEAPTVRAMARAVDELLRLAPRAAAPAIPRRSASAGADLPLSFAQERLWFLDQYEGASSAFYSVAGALRLRGEVDVEALRAAFEAIVQRHAVLRTRFESRQGQPVQVILEAPEWDLPVTDLVGRRDAEQEALRRATEDAAVPFDLARGRVLRATLYRTAEDESILSVVIHHIAGDGWSFGVLARELAALYASAVRVGGATLPELPIQYADFAAWQRQELTDETLAPHLRYWREALAGVTALDLHTDRPRPREQTHAGAEHPVRLGVEATRRVRELAHQRNATTFMVLLAAFQVLLGRYAGQRDVAVGTPIANRTRPELEGLVGFFANTLVLRVSFTDDPSFELLLDRVRQRTLAAYEHQDVPFEKLVDALGVERDIGRTPLFQAMFALQNAPFEAFALEGLDVEELSLPTKFARFDLTLHLNEQNDDQELVGRVEYNTDLFDRETIARLAESFTTLVDAIVDDPATRVCDLRLLSRKQEQLLLAASRGRETRHPRDRLLLHELIEHPSRAAPNAPAVICGGDVVTYRELDARADAAARRLRSLGVCAEARVALFTGRSIDMVVGILAILKSGAAYVPIDPDYPSERVAFMLSDSGACAIVTDAMARRRLPRTEARPLLSLSEDGHDPQNDDLRGRTTSPPSQGNAAYVIYTSGSTGTPKGVVVTHEAAVRSTLARHLYYPEPVRRFLLLSSFAFDSSVAGIFWTLSTGGAVRVATTEEARDVEALHRVLLDDAVSGDAITHVLCTPSLLQQLIGSPSWTAAVSVGLEVAIVAGEACPPDLIERARKSLPSTTLVNEYGPTEATVWATAWRSTDGAPSPRVSIGGPIPNVQVYVVDDRLRLVPIGVSGEIVIGGAGIARGYLDRPALTAERFIPNHLGEAPAERLYRSGDLGRRLADGTIELLGRVDDQVKVRGYRVELGEIESALRGHGAIRDAAVIAHLTDTSGEASLIAHVVGERVSALDLRDHLARTLPEYMLPAAYIAVETLPRSPNGKIDKRALPKLTADALRSAPDFVAPRTPTEIELADVYRTVLNVDRPVGIDDNFFHLGGHSLLATQAMARANERLGVAVPLRRLFASPTVRELARVVDSAVDASRGALPLRNAIERVDRTKVNELPLSFAQQRLWFLNEYEAGSITYNIAGAVWIDGALDIPALSAAFGKLVDRHEVLRTRIVTHEGRAMQVIDPEADRWDLDVTDLRSLHDKQEASSRALSLGKELAREPFNLAYDRLLRTQLIRVSDDRALLCIAMHHIVADGWSIAIVVRELCELYAAAKNGRKARLPELPIQYVDFASWQRAHLQGERLDQQIAYWKEKLAGAPLLDLPTDRPRPAVQTNNGAYVPVRISRETTARLRAVTEQAGATLFMTLLAGFSALLRHHTSQDDISVGTAIANRTRPELDGLIGFFVNTLVIRTDLSGNPTFKELVQRVRTTTLEAYEHQDIPFEKLVDALGVERDTSRTPLFQVVFAWQNAPEIELSLEGVTVTQVDLQSEIAKFDLALNIGEVRGEIVGRIELNTDLFDRETIMRMVEQYVVLLDAVTHDPERRVDDFAVLTTEESQRLLGEWNDTNVEFPREKCVHELFEEQVMSAPDAVALVEDGGATLTYSELDACANALAHDLIGEGVALETAVAVCVERSFEMVIAMIGILKAGGTFVPIDLAANPPERIEHMLREARISIVVAPPVIADRLSRDIVVVSSDRAKRAPGAVQPLRGRARPQSLAMIMYTSGSTGRPKGACMTHRNIARISKSQSYVSLGPDEVWFHYASSTFDATTLELWPALLNGARVVLNPPGVFDFSDFADRLKRFNVTTVWITAGLFRQLVDERIDALLGVRQIMTGGDVVSRTHVEKLLSVHPRARGDLRLINGYGPTENTVFTSIHPLTSDSLAKEGAELPIGKLVNNCQAYVLSDALVPVPTGAVGQLFVSGDGLGRGYVDARATAERWVPNPFSREPGARMYKTGDLVRWRADGNLLFVGRADGQVKIRGIRIELGEIEAALMRCEGVRGAVVIASEARPGDKRIVAYVESPRTETSAGSLREELKNRLPDYMMPAAIIVLEAFPLTDRGKIDRRALPKPDEVDDGRDRGAPEELARSPEERALAEIWSQVLGRKHVGVNDSFFALGGDSILSIQVVARAIARGIRLKARDLYLHPTIAELASVSASRVTGESGKLPTTEDDGPTGPAELLPIQRWFFELASPEPSHFNLSAMLDVDRRDLNLTSLEAAVQALVDHHDALRARYERAAGQSFRQTILPVGERVQVERIFLEHPTQESLQAAATRVQRSLDLASGPLIRAAVIDRASHKTLLVLLVVHHLVVDGVSWRILLEDLQTAYDAAVKAETIKLRAKTMPFRVWAHRVLEHGRSERARGEREYWQRIVEENIPPLPCDGDRSEEATVSDLRVVEVKLNAERTTLLLTEVPRAYGTQINDALLTALVEVLGDWAGSDAVRIDLEGHGREVESLGGDLGRTVGWFTTLFPIILRRTRGDVQATLKGVKESLRAIPSRGLSYGVLHEHVRDANGDQGRDLVFNYLGQMSSPAASQAGFRVSEEKNGLSWSPRMRPPHGLTVNVVVHDGVLRVHWTFLPSRFKRETVERLATAFITALERIITHCVFVHGAGAGGFTPSDFALAQGILTQRDLDELLVRNGLTTDARAELEDVYPLSPMQEGMLFVALSSPRAGIYFETMAMRLVGELSLSDLTAAWDDAVDAYPALRASFAWEGLKRPLQLVRRRVRTPFSEHDWTALNSEEQAARLEELAERNKEDGFDFHRAPLMRVDVIRTRKGEKQEAHEHQLVFAFHHILMDGWSMAAFFAHVFDAYAARLRGRPLLRRDPSMPYRDYIRWLLAQDPSAAESFWREALRGFERATPLPTMRGGVSKEGEKKTYAVRDRKLGQRVSAALADLAAGHGITLNTILQGIWAILLSRYSGERDVIFGAVTSGRPAELRGIESAVGLFINTLPVRVHVDADQPIVAWLRHLQTRAMELRRFEYSPLAKVQTWASDLPPGEPLFHSIFVFESYPVDESLKSENMPVTIVDFRGWETTNYPLNFIVSPKRDDVMIRLNYDTACFEADAIDRVIDHVVTLIEAALPRAGLGPSAVVGDLSLLAPAERQRILVEWNRTKASTSEKCIHALFEEHASRQPSALAVIDEDGEWTYQELDRRANQLARLLRERGVGRDVIAGVAVDRSKHAVLAILGVLKAGGAYLPLDPDYPAERLRFMIRDSGVRVLVTEERHASLFVTDGAVDMVILGLESRESPEGLSSTDARPRDLAYAIYTSGSTGAPKAAANEHRGLANLAVDQARYLGVGPGSRVLQFASLSFDASVWEVAIALGSGATLCIASRERLWSADGLERLFNEWSIDTALLPPSVLATLSSPTELRSLKTLLVGGDACPPALAERWARGLRLFNAYGPTEASVYVSIAECKDGVLPPIIGRPIGNVRLYIVDEKFEPVPVGVPGELVIGGVGVARGYIDRADLTAERFVRDPFGGDPDAPHLYRTGDVAKYHANGNIEFLGRKDTQVKVRGFRIELSEIEARLAQHPSVKDCVVIVRAERLIAYVVEDASPVSPHVLERHVAETLPEHMIPSAFVFLAEMPLTRNGKIDRKALPAPDQRDTEQERREHRAPLEGDEQVLARIWGEVLRCEQPISRDDDFFKLGGDSILGIQVVSKAAKRGLKLNARDVFTYRTIAALAVVAAATRTSERAPPASSTSAPVTGNVELLPIQRWFFEGATSRPEELNHFNMAVMLECPSDLDRERLRAAIQTLIEHHDILRARFHQREEGWRQEIVVPTRFELEPDGTLGDASKLQASLDISSGPILRAAVLERGRDNGPDGPRWLLLVIHHLVVDAVSLQILLEDLEAAYAGLPLPPKTASVQAWADRLATLEVTSSDAEGASSSTATRIPADDEDAENTGATTEVLTLSFDREETTTLLKQVPGAYGTRANEALLTALVEALADFARGHTFRIDVEGHGRGGGRESLGGGDHWDLSRTVGWFTTLVPVVLKSSRRDEGRDFIIETLKHVKEQLRAGPERALRRTDGDADVSFNYLGQVTTKHEDRTFVLAAHEVASVGDTMSPTMARRHRLTINALVRDGRLEVGFTYSGRQYRRSTIEELGRLFTMSLRGLIAKCGARDFVGGYTPTDFELAKLRASELDALLTRMGTRGRGAIDDIYPLSPMQQAMLFHTLFAPNSGVYYQQTILTLDGELDVDAFARAWQHVVAIHPILRTSFAWEGLSRPLQIVHSAATVTIAVDHHDGRQTPVDQLAVQRRSEGFELERAPLLRVDVLRMSANDEQPEHCVIISFHHLLLDGWSAARVFADVFAAYKKAEAGGVHGTSSLPYRAYIAWLEKQDERAAERHWRSVLEGFYAATPLLGDKAPGEVLLSEDKVAAVRERRLSVAATSALEAFARDHGLTLNTITQGVWALLLSRHSGETDVLFGAVTSGRPVELPGVDTSVGLFINTLPVRVLVDPERPVVEWLADLQASNIDLRRYEHSTLAQLQSWSDVPAPRPLFESLFTFENYPVDRTTSATSTAGGSLRTRDVRGWDTDNFPLSVTVVPGHELSLQINYETRRFDGLTTIEMLLDHYERTLITIPKTSPHTSLRELIALTPEERERILIAWNADTSGETAKSFPLDRPMHRLFEEQVARRPDAVAVRCGSDALTYRELNKRANRIARRLVKSGVKLDTLVALLLDRGVDFLAAMLGVFKAGGAYVPLDPSYPIERTKQILEVSRATVIIAESDDRERLGGVATPAAQHTLSVGDLITAEDGDRGDDNLDLPIDAEALAYVLFTSGSTGRPKGAMIEHRSMVNHLFANAAALGLTEVDVVAQNASQCFDISVWQFLVGLVLGGRVEIFADDVVRDPTRMMAAVEDRGVTVLEVVPSFMRMVLDEARENRITLSTLRWLMPTGEALSPALCREWLQVFPGVPLVNAYGPTECADDVTLHFITEPPAISVVNMPIGRPIANMQVYVLDEHLRPVPVGAAGELFVGGVGVGRGYIHDPALTERSFLVDPFAPKGARRRMYRTGDQARWLPDGTLEYLGRLDHQVKVRGHRIELGEIEAVLLDHERVKQCVVVVRTHEQADDRIIAYVVLSAGPPLPAVELRDLVGRRLPEYMVPAAVVVLDALPLTPNGKVDRQALPAPDLAAIPSVVTHAIVMPTTPDERAIAEIWQEVLNCPRAIGVTDNFFELGGHSLTATRIASRLRARFEMNIPLRSLFEAPTIRELAAQLGELRLLLRRAGRTSEITTAEGQELEEGVL